MAPQAIKAAEIPGDDIDPDVIASNAAKIKTLGGTTRTESADLQTEWKRMAGVYSAPESDTLLGLMDPVSITGDTIADNLETVAGALAVFADDVRPIKKRLAELKVEAQTFLDTTVANGVEVKTINPAWSRYPTSPNSGYQSPSTGGYSQTQTKPPDQYITEHRAWHEDQGAVDRNNELISQVNDQMEQLWAIERTCANKIRTLYGAAPLHSATSADDPLAYGVDELPEGAEMPWGAAVERSEGCAEASAKFVFKDFLWEGFVVGGLWGTIEGLGTLVLGYNPADGTWFQGSTYGQAWSQVGLLAAGIAIYSNPVTVALVSTDKLMQSAGGDGFLPQGVQDFNQTVDDTLVQAGKGIIAWDQWADDPGTALGTSVFNVGTLLLPGAGEAAAGVKGASAAARTLSVTGKVFEAIDPASWLFKGASKLGGFTVRGLGDLISNLKLGEKFDLPKVDVDFDVPSTQGPDVPHSSIPHDAGPSAPGDSPSVGRPADDTAAPTDSTPKAPEQSQPNPGDAPPANPNHPSDPTEPTNPHHPDEPTEPTNPHHPDEPSGSGGSGQEPRTTPPESTTPPHVWSPEDPPRHTVPGSEAPRPYTNADVQDAWDRAPVNEDGVKVDHRTGEPLLPERADGSRGWHMVWDPENGQWVAQRPGDGYANGMPAEGTPNSYGYDADGNLMPYANSRPNLPDWLVEQVWNRDSGGTGSVKVEDAFGNEITVSWKPGEPRQGLWDMGHQTGSEYRAMRDRYLNHEYSSDPKLNEEMFLADYLDPANYRVEDPLYNQSHLGEADYEPTTRNTPDDPPEPEGGAAPKPDDNGPSRPPATDGADDGQRSTDSAPADEPDGGDSGHPTEENQPPESSDSGSAPDEASRREYQMTDGVAHLTEAAPEQLGSSRVTDDLLAAHGTNRTDFIELINKPLDELTPSELTTLKSVRDALPNPTRGTWMQKVLGPGFFDSEGKLHFGVADDYITRNKNWLSGSVTVADDSSHLGTPKAIRDGLRLDYSDTPFSTNDKSVHVIRFQPEEVEFETSYHTKFGGSGEFDNWSQPFTGNGFTKAGDDIIPEYRANEVNLTEGAEIWEITDTGTQRLVAVFRGRKWVPQGVGQ